MYAHEVASNGDELAGSRIAYSTDSESFRRFPWGSRLLGDYRTSSAVISHESVWRGAVSAAVQG
jgi:hypothetical protein